MRTRMHPTYIETTVQRRDAKTNTHLRIYWYWMSVYLPPFSDRFRLEQRATNHGTRYLPRQSVTAPILLWSARRSARSYEALASVIIHTRSEQGTQLTASSR